MEKSNQTPKEKGATEKSDQQKKENDQKTPLPGYKPQGIIKSEWENLMSMFGEKEEPK